MISRRFRAVTQSAASWRWPLIEARRVFQLSALIASATSHSPARSLTEFLDNTECTRSRIGRAANMSLVQQDERRGTVGSGRLVGHRGCTILGPGCLQTEPLRVSRRLAGLVMRRAATCHLLGVGCPRLVRRVISEGREQVAGDGSVDQYEGRKLDRLRAAPRPARSGDLGLGTIDCRFGKSVVMEIFDAADRWLDLRVG